MFKPAVASLLAAGFLLSVSANAQSVELLRDGAWLQSMAISKNNSSSIDERQATLIALMNDARQKEGLSSLTFSSPLQRAAQAHVEDIVEHNYRPTHTGSDGSSMSERVRRENYSYRTIGENVAAGYASAEDTFEQWMNSRGHRENILNPSFSEVGVGYHINAPGTTYDHYWVLVLGKPAS